MAFPNYYYGCLLIITCVALLTSEIGAGNDEAGPLLGGKKLIIGLPKKSGFTQFVDLQLNPSNKTQVVKATGYSIDIFEAAIAFLESSHYNISFEFRAFVDEDGISAGNFDALVYQVYKGQYDAVVGDVSIVANRSNYVDFTLPYAPSDVKMLVKVRHNPRLNMWNFVRPFGWDLWMSIAIFSIFIGGIIFFMERRVKQNSAIENSPHKKQLSRVFSILWLPVEQAILPQRESLVKNCSKFVMVLWLILAFVLMQSYTANLSSILTVHQLQPCYPSENDVIRDPNINVGYHTDSFIGGLLGITVNDSSRVKNYPDTKEYKEALDKGSREGGVDAIFDHTSHIKIFLKQYGSNNYAMVDTRHRIAGFAYAFPIGSNLTSYFSRAILNVRESEEMDKIEAYYFGSNQEDYEGQGLSTSSDNESSKLTTYCFAGLFMVIGILSLLALAVSESHIWRRPVVLAKTYSQQWLMSWNFRRSGPLEGSSPSRRNVDDGQAQSGAGDNEAGSLLGGKKFIIGLPKKSDFTQFVDLQLNSSNKIQVVKATGYSIEVFESAISYLKSLGHNISYEYRAFVHEDGNSAGDYNELIYQIYEGKYDAVVGDVAIVANRSNYVDFALPYAPSDVEMLVRVRNDPRLNMWIFAQPFSWDLWLSIVMFSISIGGIILLMERATEEESTLENSPSRKQLSKFSILWFPLMQAVLPDRESVSKACSRFVLVLWLLLACVLMQSYTACFSSILTVHQLQPTYPSENDVINNPNINIGYPDASFLRGLFVDDLKIDSGRLKDYSNVKEYKEALDKGSRRGGVDAIFNEVVYFKIFLKQYGSNNYALVKTRHRDAGFGFAFSKGSNLTSYFSRAILNVSESEEMDQIEQKYFGSNNDIEGQDLSSDASSDNNNASASLTAYSFAGLFMVIGMLSLLALLVSESRVWKKPIKLARTVSQQLLSQSFKRTRSIMRRFSA
ncbi:hypothetical protein K1719_011482 [Acacia pycnantha]|nr:hypothetical protein K1719_011482 [Acacia pycnantha]